MSKTISTQELTSLADLFEKKENYLNNQAGNLQKKDVISDEDFQRVSEEIKEAVLLREVSFEEPTILKHTQTSRKMPDKDPIWRGNSREVYTVTVNFLFTGSEELFHYRHIGTSIPIDHIYQPSDQGVISVNVELDSLDKAKAIDKAKNAMATTFSCIETINPIIKIWSEKLASEIDSTLSIKRKEILDFYS